MANRKPTAGIPADWPASRPPEMVKVAAITPHPENPRTHPDAQIDGLGEAFDEFGVMWPIIVDENLRLMAGEGRWKTAQRKKFEEYPCIVIRGWSEAKKRRFMVADNRLPELAGYDDALYRAVLSQIKSEGLPTASLGLSDDAIAAVVDGWKSDINVRDKFGSNLDGTGAKIVVVLGEKSDDEAARAAIGRALKRAKIVCEIR